MLLHVKFNIHYLKKNKKFILNPINKNNTYYDTFLNKMFNVVNAFYNIPIIES